MTGMPGWGEPEVIRFDDDRSAFAWRDTGADPALLRTALDVKKESSVIVVCGGANDLTGAPRERAKRILGPAVSAAAATSGAVVIDGGTASGVMEMVGAQRARRPDDLPVLIGVAPTGKVSYPGKAGNELFPLEQNHTHFVLADSNQWGGETRLLIRLAAALAEFTRPVMVLAGGGQVATAEVLSAVRGGWPVFVIQGTGGLADVLLSDKVPADLNVQEIVQAGDLRPYAEKDHGQLARELSWELHNEPVLKSAWQDFAAYDQLATRLRRMFARFEAAVLLLGVTATLLALIYAQVHGRFLHWLIVAVPILVSVLITLTGRQATGQRWVLLRGAAETIKAEIYRYRTHASPYGMATGRMQLLADRIAAVHGRLMATEVSGGELPSYMGLLPPAMYGAGRSDDGLSPLTAERYLSIRVNDQLAYYRGRTATLKKRRNVLQLVAILSGGAGTLLAAAGFDIWVGLTSGLAAAAIAYLSYLQVDNTIVTYNQCAVQLSSLERRWLALSVLERDTDAFEKLVTAVEKVLATELADWVHQMSDAMTELKNRQDDDVRSTGKSATH